MHWFWRAIKKATTKQIRVHWLWRGAVAVLVGRLFLDIVAGVVHFAVIAPLGRGTRALGVVVPLLNQLIVICGLIACVITYTLLMRGYYRYKGHDSETRCRKCGYILRGISEPRCPECGERI